MALRRHRRNDTVRAALYVHASPASRAMVMPCQQKSIGGSPRQLSHGPKIGFGEGRLAGSSAGQAAFSSQINRCGNASRKTRAHREC